MSPAQLARRVELDGAALGLPGIGQIGRYRYAAAYEHRRTQRHPTELTICFLARGRQAYRVGDTLHQLAGNEQHVIPPGVPHDTAGWPEEKGELFWLTLRMRPSHAPLLHLTPAAAVTLRTALQELPTRPFAAEPGLRECWARVLTGLACGPSKIEHLEIVQAIVELLFATLRAAGRDQRQQPSPRIRRCLDHIEARVHEPLYVPELAAVVGLSESHFKVRFRREVGLPPGEYILRAKIAAAREALARPGSRVTAVAHGLGFSSSQYFATVFRRYTGQSPTAARDPRRP
jgi:AraC-like DNA-binding protein